MCHLTRAFSRAERSEGTAAKGWLRLERVVGHQALLHVGLPEA